MYGNNSSKIEVNRLILILMNLMAEKNFFFLVLPFNNMYNFWPKKIWQERKKTMFMNVIDDFAVIVQQACTGYSTFCLGLCCFTNQLFHINRHLTLWTLYKKLKSFFFKYNFEDFLVTEPVFFHISNNTSNFDLCKILKLT